MSEIMPLEVLAGIKNAEPSRSVEELFEVIDNALPGDIKDMPVETRSVNIIGIGELREDVVVESTSREKDLIINNFPRVKNGFLVVSKVIEE
jgi:Asp-tRNA(Asn)/Glu-tRNA(Gln) amidotransferase C subunit